MDSSLRKVNAWARKSCTKWNKCRLSRRFYRRKYRKAAQKSWESSEHRALIARYQEGARYINTYPWPYKEPDFASWEEDASQSGYSLISDQSGCVIRYSTSYCAWKIFETTGTWPQKTSSERLDAKRCQQFLAEAGYTDIVTELEPDHFYVGINPDEGEWGIVVWYEAGAEKTSSRVCVSSYVEGKHKLWWATVPDFIWVKIK